MVKEIGIAGLGRIGMPAARSFLNGGYTVFGYDILKTKVDEFEALGGTPVPTAAALAKHVKTVLVMVLNDAQVIEVIAAEHGILKGSNDETVVVCMSTINRKTLETVYRECTAQKVRFLDCPFTGGPARVPSGNLTLIASGPLSVLEDLRNTLGIIGNIVYAGQQAGLGQAVKHCNQLLVAATHAATMEVITLARKLNLDPALVCDVVGKGISGSDYFRLLSESVLSKKPSPGSLGQMSKDVAIVKNTVREIGMSAYVTMATAKYFELADSMGMQQREGADLIEIVAGARD